jgi:hypothetical protein
LTHQINKTRLYLLFYGLLVLPSGLKIDAQVTTPQSRVIRLNKPQLADATDITFDFTCGPPKFFQALPILMLKVPITTNSEGDYLFQATNSENQSFSTNFMTTGKVDPSQTGDVLENETAIINIPTPVNWTKNKIFEGKKEIFSTTFRKFSKSTLESYSIIFIQCDSVYKIKDWGVYGMPDEAAVLFKRNPGENWSTSSIYRRELNQWANQGEWGEFLENKDKYVSNYFNCEVKIRFRYGLQWIIYDFPQMPENP